MKKIRFFQVFNVCVYNVAFSESKILNLIDDFETGRIAAAAARRRFLDLWYNFIIDVQRYNSVLIAWRVYDADSLKKSTLKDCKYINLDDITGKYYNYFFA